MLSLALTNLNKRLESKKKVKFLPESLKEFGKNYDYDICFEVIRFVLGMLVTVVLVSISSIFHLQNTQFGKLAYGFYIDAFLFPLILFILFTGLAVIATMSEFFSNDVGIIFRIIYFLLLSAPYLNIGESQRQRKAVPMRKPYDNPKKFHCHLSPSKNQPPAEVK